MGNKKGVVSGQEAWVKTGFEMSQSELDEYNNLKAKLRSGIKLTYEQETRLFKLREKLRSIAHIE